MRFITILFIVVISQFTTVSGQTGSSSVQKVQNAKYLGGNLSELIKKRIVYPEAAIENSIDGDVIVSFVVNSNGKLDSLTVTESPGDILSVEVKSALKRIMNNWMPCRINGNKVNRQYSIVFRFRLYKNRKPPVYRERADKLFIREKYKKALKFYNRAIEDNSYDYRLFDSRAETRDELGDTEGADTDFRKAERLQNTIITVVDIVVIRTTHMNSVI